MTWYLFIGLLICITWGMIMTLVTITMVIHGYIIATFPVMAIGIAIFWYIIGKYTDKSMGL